MKKKQERVKLNLKKITVVSFDQEKLAAVQGGAQVKSFYPTLFPYCDFSYMFACLPVYG